MKQYITPSIRVANITLHRIIATSGGMGVSNTSADNTQEILTKDEYDFGIW